MTKFYGTHHPDTLNGSTQDDELYGQAGNDVLSGGNGNDLLDGGSGADRLYGGAGNDVYVVDDLGDVVFEGGFLDNGNDIVQTWVDFTLPGGIEILSLLGSAAISGNGNALDNHVYGNLGANVINGGAGHDTIEGRGGDDTLDGGDGSDTLMGDDGHDTLRGGAGVDQLIGGAGRDVLEGGDDDDALSGGEDDDVLDGGNGNDELNGGGGRDQLRGGLGNDIYRVDDVFDSAIDSSSLLGGIDLVYAAVHYTLGAASHIENLTLTGSAPLNGGGNALANILTGNGAANALDGGAGNDTLYGGSGNDVLSGGAGFDTLYGGSGSSRDAADHDRFVFGSADEAWGDAVRDFRSGKDTLDFSAIDANASTAGINEAFRFIGQADFSSRDATGQLRFENGVIYGSTDADAQAEFFITLTGVTDLLAGDVIA